MESAREYNSIVHSPSFTFLVGPNHTRLTIQTALAKHVSKPLDLLMNNGETRESKHRIAVLEDEEVEVFVAFCEYAYTCDYSVPLPGSDHHGGENPWKGMFRSESVSSIIPPPVPTPPPGSIGTPERFDHNPFPSGHEPFPSQGSGLAVEGNDAPTEGERHPPADDGPGESSEPGGKKNKKGKKDKKKQRGPGGVSFDESALNLTPPSTPPPEQSEDYAKPAGVETAAASSAMGEWWNQSQSAGGEMVRTDEKEKEPEEQQQQQQQQQQPPFPPEALTTSFVPQNFNPLHPKEINIWDEFSGLDYPFQKPVKDISRLGSGPGVDLPYILFHAKLYVFASRYLIPALAQLCLQKLHKDLATLSFSASGNDNQSQSQDYNTMMTIKAKMILDLMHYTYTRTTRYEPVHPNSPTLLRENELRKLVTHYAACKVRELAAFTPMQLTTYPAIPGLDGAAVAGRFSTGGGLKDLLDTTTELASDLVFRMIA
ncbi:hypothetical protein DTO280E4_3843 [Paecilomyces variotii]|nr:hypothetical protein DTO169E5_6819 [Paecilomyces variotii]KAJ9253634.1 hypothetical protein DTO207G8_4058 [Paecilomyces variotii]KAJ9287600.1 hypothetical protein DTO021C3_4893 [Paecilomyces variotii]KAJ9309800.1 hypothetical protein DTO217A2_751 [Paecilomyces variotii]KAJ9361369.1 hypothetical protein DTO280E4_3843 [Paecilomyces variotii]